MTSTSPSITTTVIASIFIASSVLQFAASAGVSETAQATPSTATSAPADIMAADKLMMTKKLMMEKKQLASAVSIHEQQTCTSNGLALAGIDVVSYHKPGGPLIGHADYTTEHSGLTYRFLSQDHLDAFVANPDAWLPSYMGWCATSLSFGVLTCPNPLNYKIENGRLLLFETTGFTNGQVLWNTDPLDYRRKADRNSRKFLAESEKHPTPAS